MASWWLDIVVIETGPVISSRGCEMIFRRGANTPDKPHQTYYVFVYKIRCSLVLPFFYNSSLLPINPAVQNSSIFIYRLYPYRVILLYLYYVMYSTRHQFVALMIYRFNGKNGLMLVDSWCILIYRLNFILFSRRHFPFTITLLLFNSCDVHGVISTRPCWSHIWRSLKVEMGRDWSSKCWRLRKFKAPEVISRSINFTTYHFNNGAYRRRRKTWNNDSCEKKWCKIQFLNCVSLRSRIWTIH